MAETKITVKSAFEKMAEKILTDAATAVTDSAAAIETEIKGRIWDKKIPVRTRLTSKFQAHVVVGSRKRFYAGFNEYGTIHQSPKPVVRPAAEHEGARFIRQAKSVLADLDQLSV